MSVDDEPLTGPVNISGGWAAFACALSDGRERVIDNEPDQFEPEGQWSLSKAVLAGNYVALLEPSAGKYCGAISQLKLFDLQTDLPVRQLTTSCAQQDTIDQIAVGSDGVMAAHTSATNPGASGGFGCDCELETIQASDATGTHTLDSVTQPDGSPTALTNLILTGDTLTWDHDGSPRSAELQP